MRNRCFWGSVSARCVLHCDTILCIKYLRAWRDSTLRSIDFSRSRHRLYAFLISRVTCCLVAAGAETGAVARPATVRLKYRRADARHPIPDTERSIFQH